MGFGAALALMIAGAAMSLYAAVAVASIVRVQVFVLYVLLAGKRSARPWTVPHAAIDCSD